MNLVQRGRASASVRVKWLVLEKIYGNKLRKLLNKIKENSEIKINVVPFILLILSKILNSLCRVEVILIHIKLIREGINQNIVGKKIKPSIDLNQFNEKFVLVEGSNVENRFVIISSLFYLILVKTLKIYFRIWMKNSLGHLILRKL